MSEAGVLHWRPTRLKGCTHTWYCTSPRHWTSALQEPSPLRKFCRTFLAETTWAKVLIECFCQVVSTGAWQDCLDKWLAEPGFQSAFSETSPGTCEACACNAEGNQREPRVIRNAEPENPDHAPLATPWQRYSHQV